MEEKVVNEGLNPEIKVDINKFHTFKELRELYFTYIFKNSNQLIFIIICEFNESIKS